MKKRGLSPVIATILLILLVILIIIIIFLWMRNFLQERIEKFGQPIERYCNSASFNVDLFEIQGGNADYEITFLNKGNVGISGFELKKIREGNSEVIKLNVPLPIESSYSSNINLLMSDKTKPKSVIFYPILKGNIQGRTIEARHICYDIKIQKNLY